MKRWRIARHHPEDRYEPDDEIADGIREKLREIESYIQNLKTSVPRVLLNNLFLERRNLQIELPKRLYGE